MAKKATGGYELGPKAIGQIQELWRDYQARARAGGGSNAAEPFTKFGPRVFRWAKCQANSKCQSYPAKPANNFPIVLGELDVDTDSCGYQVRTFTAYEPAEDRIAHDPYDIWREEGDIVAVYLAHEKWYILGGVERMFAEAVLDGDLCALDNDDMSEQEVAVANATYIPNCKSFDPDKVTNPRRHAGFDGAKVLMIRKQCNDQDEHDTEEWQLLDVELQKVCTVNGIQKRLNSGSTDTGAIVYGIYSAQAEYCPPEVPADGCVIVKFGPCDATVTPNNIAWTLLVNTDCCEV